ncbi:hypothetical protein GCM10010109_58620 [Actinoplanes campanulatus]|nr:hypothetical protein GCM10010109_58620 [Actinoplanes campanulatus]GID38847.1 hypothetical protein Aca09nite_53530 [Actinoplanes campanulatus]
MVTGSGRAALAGTVSAAEAQPVETAKPTAVAPTRTDVARATRGTRTKDLTFINANYGRCRLCATTASLIIRTGEPVPVRRYAADPTLVAVDPDQQAFSNLRN